MAPEGAAICDSCNEILDPSFLDGDEAPVAGDKTDVGPPPTGPADLRPARLRQRSRGSWEPRKQVPDEPAPRRPFLAPAPAAAAPSPADEARRTAQDLRSFFATLSPADRWAAGASIGLLVTMVLPWRWTREDDEVIGLVAAFPIALLAAGLLALLYIRASRAGTALDRRLRLGQLATAALAAISTGLYLPWATENHALRAAGRTIAKAVSSPQVGAYLGLACALAALAASLPILRDDR